MTANVSSSGFNPRNPHLAGVLLKMHRAQKHMQDLDAALEAWLNGNPWSVATERDANGRPLRAALRIVTPLPDEVGLIIGDAVHNLRTALDHLAGAAALRNGRGTKGVYFPIASDASESAAAVRKKLRKTPESFRKFVATLHPHKGGNDALYILHHLDILDKHQIITLIGSGVSVTVEADQGFYGAFNFSKITGPIKLPSRSIRDGDTIFNYAAGSWLPQETVVHTEAAITVIFDDGSAAAGRGVGETLGWLNQEVSRVVALAEIEQFR